MFKSLLISSLVLNIGLMVGRLSGFFRESIMAMTYGVTSEADIVVLMLTVPDLLVNILVGGAMGVVLIPEFNANPDKAKKLLYQAMVFFGVIFTLISATLYWNSYYLIEILAPGFDNKQIVRSSLAIKWVIWLVPLTVLSGVVTSYLHSKNKFIVASLGTLIINITIIIGLVLVYLGFGSIFMLAMFVLLGGLLRLVSQLISSGVHFNFRRYFDVILINKSILSRYLQAFLSGSVLLLIPVVSKAFSSYSGEGSVAIMNYSTRLIEFPLAISITVFVVVLFPRISDSFLNNKKMFNKLVVYGVQIITGISLLIMVALTLLNEHYVDIVYNHGSMTPSDLIYIQRLTLIGMIALPLQGVTLFLTSVFHAQRNTQTPLIINSIGLLIFILIFISNVLDNNLVSIMQTVILVYILTTTLLIVALKIEGLKIQQIFLSLEFVLGLLVSLFLLSLSIIWIENLNMGSGSIMTISIFIGIIFILVFALFNQDFRLFLRKRYYKL